MLFVVNTIKYACRPSQTTYPVAIAVANLFTVITVTLSLDVCVLLSIVELSFFLSHEGLRPVEESLVTKTHQRRRRMAVLAVTKMEYDMNWVSNGCEECCHGL
jgi:hypothetical protein